MAKNTEIVAVEDTNPPPKQQQLQLPNLFSVFSNFNLHFPFLNPPPKPNQKQPDGANNNVVASAPVTASVGDQVSGGKPNFVRIPNAQVAATIATPSLQVETEESSTKTSNPIIIWQVYAIGAFFVAQWALSRWKERKDRGGPRNDDNRAE